MAVETDADRLAAFFNTSEFAVTASVSHTGPPDYQVDVAGLYDDPYIGVEAGGVFVGSSEPRFTCRASDVPGIVVGDTVDLTAAGYGNFSVRSVEPDGQGLMRMTLHDV